MPDSTRGRSVDTREILPEPAGCMPGHPPVLPPNGGLSRSGCDERFLAAPPALAGPESRRPPVVPWEVIVQRRIGIRALAAGAVLASAAALTAVAVQPAAAATGP